MKTTFTIICIFTIATLSAKHKSISIENAYKSGLISFKIRGTGTYKGDCLKIYFKNKIEDSLFLLLEAGRRLDSRNNMEQDILVTKDQIFILSGHQKKEFKVYGFCCQATNHSPGKDSVFSIGQTADYNLHALSMFCNMNKFDLNETQSAVWCISDKRPLASIPESNEKLRKFVSKITKEEIPWYQIEYEKSSSNTFISDNIERISGNITYTLTKSDFYNIELRDAKGNLIQNYTNKKPAVKGTYDYWFDMQVTNYPKGKYFIHIYNGNELVTKKQFEL